MESMTTSENPEATPDLGSAAPAEEVAVSDLIEDVSIDGMCGVY